MAGRIETWLFGAYLGWWAAWSIAPHDRMVWVFENLLVVAGLPVVVLTRKRFRFSSLSYALMFVFLCLHAIGAHYGYSSVPLPWREWGFSRNHTDRVVHFLFGAFVALPLQELLVRLGRVRAGWSEGLAVALAFALAALFEVIEWLAVLVGGDLAGPPSTGYLGTQGDGFDAVKDMALGLAGAAVTMAVASVWRRGRRDAGLRQASASSSPRSRPR